MIVTSRRGIFGWKVTQEPSGVLEMFCLGLGDDHTDVYVGKNTWFCTLNICTSTIWKLYFNNFFLTKEIHSPYNGRQPQRWGLKSKHVCTLKAPGYWQRWFLALGPQCHYKGSANSFVHQALAADRIRTSHTQRNAPDVKRSYHT